MATQLFLDGLNNDGADTHRGTNSAKLDGAASGWQPLRLSTARGSGSTFASNTATVTGPTNGVEIVGTASVPNEWLSPPVSADVTISGTITANIWAHESAMTANVAINVVIDIIRSDASNTIVQIVKSTNVVELGTSSAAVNFTTGMTSGSYTAQTLNRGDRLRIRVFGDDSTAATMASGATFTIQWRGSTAGAGGDSYVTFTENFSFESAPSGTVIYLTDTASPVSTASVDREAWTARGSGVVNDVTNTAAGFTSPIQVTDTAGGTVVDWFTKQLQAVTLTGMAVANLRAIESNSAGNASLRLEIARVESDGTSPTVWASWCMSTDAVINTVNGEISTIERAETVNVSGDDLAISDGQRLRIRLYIDDFPIAAMGAGHTVTTYYSGTSGGASGDSFITFPVTLTEFTAASPGPVWRRRPAHRFLTMR